MYCCNRRNPTSGRPFYWIANADAPRVRFPADVLLRRLPPGWASTLDPESGRTYYYDEENDGKGQWALPDGISTVEVDDDVPMRQECLPPGWKSAVDPESGRTYYYDNTNGGLAQWALPGGFCFAVVDDSEDEPPAPSASHPPAASAPETSHPPAASAHALETSQPYAASYSLTPWEPQQPALPNAASAQPLVLPPTAGTTALRPYHSSLIYPVQTPRPCPPSPGQRSMGTASMVNSQHVHPIYGDGQYGQQPVQTSFRSPAECARLGIHAARKYNGAPWETQHGIGFQLHDQNIIQNFSDSTVQSLLATLFADYSFDIPELHRNLLATAGAMVWYHMSTHMSKYQAWTARCRHCGCLMEAAWRPTSTFAHRRLQQIECLHWFLLQIPVDNTMILERTLPME